MRYYRVLSRLTNLLFFIILIGFTLLTASAAQAATYTWVGTGGNNNWTTASNWEPARTPAADDILLFDGSKTASANVLVDFVSPQAIGQIQFTNSVSVVLTVLPDETLTPSSSPLPPPARLLNISGNLLGADFEITAGCSVQVRSPDGKRTIAGLVFQLGANETANIAGTLIFGGSAVSNTNDPHKLVGQRRDSRAIFFAEGSLFRAEATFSGEAFGSGTALNNTVVFDTGSTYEQRGGGAPFANNQPNTVVILNAGSRYVYATNTAAGPQLPGRTYGILEYNGTNSSIIGSASLSLAKTIIYNDLIIKQGNIRLNVANVDIKGKLILNGGALVNPTSESIITFSGNAPQFITSTATIPVPASFGNNVTLTIDNATGVTL